MRPHEHFTAIMSLTRSVNLLRLRSSLIIYSKLEQQTNPLCQCYRDHHDGASKLANHLDQSLASTLLLESILSFICFQSFMSASGFRLRFELCQCVSIFLCFWVAASACMMLITVVSYY